MIKDAEGDFKAKTTSYDYSLLAKQDNSLRALLEFHWHPESTRNLKWPHLHVIANTHDGDLNRVHFPTGRLCIEDFIRVLIRDFGIKARMPYDEWKRILAKNKAAFCDSASWLYYKPLI